MKIIIKDDVVYYIQDDVFTECYTNDLEPLKVMSLADMAIDANTFEVLKCRDPRMVESSRVEWDN